MTPADLDRPADLTLWPGDGPARVGRGRTFPTLRAALRAASEAMADEGARAWITTEAGDILTPNWVRANTDAPVRKSDAGQWSAS